MDIRTFQYLPDAERKALFGWGEDIFGMTPYDLNWRSKDWHFVLYEDGNHVCNNIPYKYRPLVADWLRKELA